MGVLEVCDGSVGVLEVCDGSVGVLEVCDGSVGVIEVCDGSVGVLEVCDGSVGVLEVCDGSAGHPGSDLGVGVDEFQESGEPGDAAQVHLDVIEDHWAVQVGLQDKVSPGQLRGRQIDWRL